MNLSHDRLQQLVTSIFQHAGCQAAEAQRIAMRLVEANLVGHDSHGVIRTPIYVQWLRDGKVRANQRAKVVFENDAIAVIDGGMGFGQSIAKQAMQLGIEKAKRAAWR